MIRLIASDIDGTLLPYDETVMPQRLFPLIRRLREASGGAMIALGAAIMPLEALLTEPRGARSK